MNASSSQPFVISRTFNAPRDLVWKAWTDRESLMQWFGPKGFTMPTCNLDLRPGGTLHYCLLGPDGKDMWGKWIFREVVKPERLVLIQHFSDKDGGMTRHPFAADWPRETLSATTFTEKDGKTTITIEWSPYNATDLERKIFDDSRPGMDQGWGGTFEQLTNYLAKVLAEKK